jgi:ElaB/YqjD/DUF883 family membrane-anchored ribosome-binding protein
MSIHERNDKQPQEGGEHSSSASRAAAERHDVMRRVGRVGRNGRRLERRVRELAGRMPDLVRDTPRIIEREVREHPYRTLGIAAMIGGSVGLIVGSRLVRMLLTTATSYALAELSKAVVRRYIEGLGEEEDAEGAFATQ